MFISIEMVIGYFFRRERNGIVGSKTLEEFLNFVHDWPSRVDVVNSKRSVQ